MTVSPHAPSLRQPPIPFSALEGYGVDPVLIAAWQEAFGERLLPVQDRAIKEARLLDGGNLLVLAATGAGKTGVGEIAAAVEARRGKRVFFLVPQRALATEKYRAFAERYGKTGIRVVVSSRDHREHDAQIREGHFDIAIVVFEKLSALMIHEPNLMRATGLVVVDELQLLMDRERGAKLELLLTKILTSPEGCPRIIGLSAVFGNAERLAKWLKARVLIEKRRPVELRQGVWSHGKLHFREHNSGEMGIEEMKDGRGNPEDLRLHVVSELCERGEQTILFVRSRREAISSARKLALQVALPPAAEALEELAEAENTQLAEILQKTLARGVAFHHGEMTEDERAIVERAFRSGEARALVSTSTLAMGVNLPIKNVVIDDEQWLAKGCFDAPELRAIPKADYENMSGRAGRLGLCDGFGRSILVTHLPFAVPGFFERFIDAELPEAAPALGEEDGLEDFALDLIAARRATSRAKLRALALATFTGHVRAAEPEARAELVAKADRALATLVEGKLVKQTGGGGLYTTKVGQAAADRGVGAETAIAFVRWAVARQRVEPTPLELFTLLGQTTAGKQVAVRYRRNHDSAQQYKARLIDDLRKGGLLRQTTFAPFTAPNEGFDADDTKVIKKAFAMVDWMNEVPTRDIEDHYQIPAGSLRRIGEEYAWLFEGLIAIARAADLQEPWLRTIAGVARRCKLGVREDAVAVMELRVWRLRRAAVESLRRAALLDLAALAAASDAVVGELVGSRRAAEALIERARRRVAGPATPVSTAPPSAASTPRSPDAEPARQPVRSKPAPGSAVSTPRRASRLGPASAGTESPRPRAPVPLTSEAYEEPSADDAVSRAADDDGGASDISSTTSDHAAGAVSRQGGATVGESSPLLADPGADLVIEHAARRGSLWGTDLPPGALTPQLFGALTALAMRAGKVVSMAELAALMASLDGDDRKTIAIAPDAADLRYRLRRALKAVLGPAVPYARVNALIKSVKGSGLLLDCTAVLRALPTQPTTERLTAAAP